MTKQYEVTEPVRLSMRALPGQLARDYASVAAGLMVVPVLVEVDRAAFPSVPVGELVTDRLAGCGVPELVALINDRWPALTTATEADGCVVEALDLVSEWADHFLGSAMTAARLNERGGGCHGLVAA